MLSRFALVLLLAGAVQAAPPKPKYPYTNSLKLVDFTTWIHKECHYKKGFLTSTQSGFRWSDGTRARFWGMNIANRNLWIERAEIDAVVDSLASSGVNLVRFEALDSKGALLEIADVPGTRKINSSRLDTLHYWISKLHQKGIYYYLDLIDFREFQPEDGVENARLLPRAGRPYAVFDGKLIELQKEYAQQLLTTVNPYTQLAPANDPALVMMEICNESGFFLYPKATDNLVEPYRTRFEQRWNTWLMERYRSRAELAKAWGSALSEGESPEQATVRLPLLLKPDAPPRQLDGVEFLYDVERAYFATMRDHLRSLGVRIPITAVVSSDVPAELAAVAAELDFLSENHYADHPSFGGTEWQGKFFYNNKNALRDDSRFAFPPFTAQLRWESKPVVIREWASVWPNQFRANSIPEAAAYSRLQDFDGVILFGYKTGSVRDRLVEFGYQVDPTVWDLFGLGSLIFLRGDVSTPSQIALLEYADDKLFRGTAGDTDLVRLALSLRLASSRAMGKVPVGDLTVFPVGQAGPKATEWLKQLPVEGGGKALDGSGTYTSINAQIVRDSGRGRLYIQTPRTLCIAGELATVPTRIPGLSLATQTPVGAIVLQSLDGKDLAKSQRWIAKMVSVAENTGQKLIPAGASAPAAFVLDQPGTAPVLSKGILAAGATRLTLWNNEEMVVDQANGTWEFLLSGGKAYFWSDLPGSSLHYQGRRFTCQGELPAAQPFLQPAVVSNDANPFAPTFP
ncbi:beta-galactosidase [bacterium]|nr:beta-galactosidase [bacterium]